MTTAKQNPYLLRTPCPRCPFRSDIEPYLRPTRAAEIARGLAHSGSFTCHKTTVGVEDDEGSVVMVDGPKAQQCAGATILLLKSDLWPQMLRIAERIGALDTARLDMAAPVHDSLDAWVAAHSPAVPTVTTESGEVLELEHCGVVGYACEDPAGYAMGGGAISNPDPSTCNPERSCSSCGNTMCDSCVGVEDGPDGSLCVLCEPDDDEDNPGA